MGGYCSQAGTCSRGLVGTACSPAGADPNCILDGIQDPNTGLCVPALPSDLSCTGGGSYGTTLEGPNDPHTGACNLPAADLGSLPTPLSPGSGFPLNAGTAPWAKGDAVLLLNVVQSLRVLPADCDSPLPGDPNAALAPFTTGMASSRIMDADATAGAVLSNSQTGAPFTCERILNSVATGAALSYASPGIDAGLATSDVAAAIKLTAQ